MNITRYLRTRQRVLAVISVGGSALSAWGCGGKVDSLRGDGAAPYDEYGGATAGHPKVTGFDKVDILFVVDNSMSMGDKQAVLVHSVPVLLSQLTNPDCIDPSGGSPAVQVEQPGAECPPGYQRRHFPVSDIHIGIVTSSLGDFGGDTCPEDGQAQNQAMNDHARLLGVLPRTQSRLEGVPFLTWSPANSSDYLAKFDQQQRDLGLAILEASSIGCGNEMPLEAMYRFLVDPEPTTDVLMESSAANFRGPVDNDILSLRRQFLRPDSLVAIVLLSDENDCSMRDDGYSWVPMTAAAGFRMWRSTAVCDSSPNDPCCYSCMLDQYASAACRAKDTSCSVSEASARLTSPVDDVNLRCRQTKKRFGYDFLFPPSRYVHALTQPELCPKQTYGDLDCSCSEAKAKGVDCKARSESKFPNPLFSNLDPSYQPSGPLRKDAQAIYFAGIVGVPWQDLARDASENTVLEYASAEELHWDWFAPKVSQDYSTATLLDPLMIESTAPRQGTHPVTGESLAPPDAPLLANRINGHEWNTADKDVQYACIFSLGAEFVGNTYMEPEFCNLVSSCGPDDSSDEYRICARRFDGCTCTVFDPLANNLLDPNNSHAPVCQNPDGSYGSTQFFAKAYPGLRQLQVLRGFYEATASNNAVVGSICPKHMNTSYSARDYGYNPTFYVLENQLATRLLGYAQ